MMIQKQFNKLVLLRNLEENKTKIFLIIEKAK